MITRETSTRIARCYREIEAGNTLLGEVKKEIERYDQRSLFDRYGNERGVEMGIPSGDNATRIFHVAPRLALSVIRAHIAEKETELAEANEQARIELG